MGRRRRRWRFGTDKIDSPTQHVYKVKIIVQPEDRSYRELNQRVIEYPFSSYETRNTRIKRIKNPNWKKLEANRRHRWFINDPVYMVTFTTIISDYELERVRNNTNIISLELIK